MNNTDAQRYAMSKWYEVESYGYRHSSGYSPKEGLEFLRRIGIDIRQDNMPEVSNYLQGWVGIKWHDCLKSPYFKISTLFAEKLTGMKIKMPAKMIAVPMPAFAIRLEANHGIRALGTTNADGVKMEVESVIVMCSPQPCTIEQIGKDPFHVSPENNRSLSLTVKFTGGFGAFFQASLRADEIPSFHPDACSNDPLLLNCSEAVLRLVIGTCCLATSNQEWLNVDVLSRDAERYRKCQSGEERKRIEQRAVSRGKRGWIINPEIILPREEQPHRSDEAPTGKHLKFRHHRSSHVAMVRCGSGRQSAKLVIRKWCVVRPDLPDNPSHQKKYRTA